jgi:endonuclease/exonuclease/phosphatase (EEP) superfamily protein YafD
MRWLDRLLLAAAALLAGVSVLPLAAQWWWILELTTHFRVQYLAATAVLLVLVALRRRWVACAVLVAAGAVSAAPVLPYLRAPFAAEPVTAAAVTLKVLSVNVSYRAFSARRLLDIVRETSPDVLVLQELTPHAERVLADLDIAFPHYRKFPAPGPAGIALWSRYELESSATIAIGRRPAIEARVRGPSSSFTVIGVHLSAPMTRRRAAARNQELIGLARRISAIEGPLIVAGDFNITPYSPYFADWIEATGLTDSRRGRTLSVSWPTMFPVVGIPIDHVMANDDFAIMSHGRLPNFESDHYGVLVELALTGAVQP